MTCSLHERSAYRTDREARRKFEAEWAVWTGLVALRTGSALRRVL